MIDVYTCRIGATINQLQTAVHTFYLNNSNRSMAIRSISLDYVFSNANSYAVCPIENQTTQVINLQVGDTIAPQMISKAFENFSVAPIGNGTHFRMWKRGQLLFNSWFIRNQLRFNLTMTNLDPIEPMVHEACIIIETEPINE